MSALEHNDVLACLFARVLLWSHLARLPQSNEPAYAWRYYLATWRPGKPHETTWGPFFAQAWAIVKGRDAQIAPG